MNEASSMYKWDKNESKINQKVRMEESNSDIAYVTYVT